MGRGSKEELVEVKAPPQLQWVVQQQKEREVRVKLMEVTVTVKEVWAPLKEVMDLVPEVMLLVWVDWASYLEVDMVVEAQAEV